MSINEVKGGLTTDCLRFDLLQWDVAAGR